jgi:UDP-N-acetyl-D-glucosamine dehydrogenase
MSDIQPGFKNRPLVCVQGLGFVGLAMATVIANACDRQGVPLYQVVGVDLPNNRERFELINQGILPFKSEDLSFEPKLKQAVLINKNLRATCDEAVYEQAQVVVVDIPLDIEKLSPVDYSHYALNAAGFKSAMRTLGQKISCDCLVIIETTVPPGFCSKVVKPILEQEFKARQIASCPQIAHSYERVMPGRDYLKSISNYFRTFAGNDAVSAKKAREFLSSIIKVEEFPLREETGTEASELAKILENSYRAVNIALIYEWTLLAEKMGINLFSVIEGIKVRSTHNNIMKPGFGVGGYCLTKDSLLALWSADNFYASAYGLPFSKQALEINDKMPLHALDLIAEATSLDNKKLAILGISYREDVGDTRFSPAEIFYREAEKRGAKCFVNDPYLDNWKEVPEAQFIAFDEGLSQMDILVFATRHNLYLEAGKEYLVQISKSQAFLVDTFDILDDDKIKFLLAHDREVIGVGKGHIKKLRQELNCPEF